MKIFSFNLFLLLSSVLIFPCDSYSQTFAGSVSASAGGTGVGVVEPSDSVLLNPATVAQIPTKFFAVSYAESRWGITMSDNGKEALFPAALAYYKYSWDQLKRQDMSVTVAHIFNKNFALGLNILFLEYDDRSKPIEETHRQTAADLGGTYAINENFAFGATLKSFYKSRSELADSEQRTQTVVLGTSFTFDNLSRFRFDIETNDKNKTDRLAFKYGIESFLNDWLVLRLGYQNNNVLSKNFQTAGIGFVGPQFSFHYGYLADVNDSSENRHSVDLGVPF